MFCSLSSHTIVSSNASPSISPHSPSLPPKIPSDPPIATPELAPMSRPSVLLAALAQRLLSSLHNPYHDLGIVDLWVRTLAANLKLIQPAAHAVVTTELISAVYDAENVLDRLEYRILQLRAESEAGYPNQHQVLVLAERFRPPWTASVLLLVLTCKLDSSIFSRILKGEADLVVLRLGAEVHRDQLHEFAGLVRQSLRHFSEQLLLDFCEVMRRSERIFESLQHVLPAYTRVGDVATRAESLRPVSLGEPELVGRYREKEYVWRFLLRTAANTETCSYVNVEVLPVIGVGGVGKSALARWVYNDDYIKQHFELKAWVRTSEAFQLERLMIVIAESIGKAREFHGPQDLESIRKVLSKGLAGKRFLIVLDDVQEEEEMIGNWEILLETLKVGKEGSKVLITTQSRTVAMSTGTFNRVYLHVLKDADCWSLFKQCAFGDINPEDHPELKDIGMTITRRLGGLPLEVKLLGGLLKSNFNESDWRTILKEYSMIDANSEAFPSVRISYAYLPEHLKQCFAYSSLFPRDYGFQKDRLVRIWMALGFVIPCEGKKIEEIGRAYFDDLSQRFFFEKKQYQDGYIIHEKLYDVAYGAASDECHVIKDSFCRTFPMELRHLYICTDSLEIIPKSPSRLKHIRSLIVQGKFNADGLVNILEVFEELRVLVLSEVCIKSLPESIGKLIHLRYLELHKLDVVELPDSVCRLYHLEGLDVSYCVKLQQLPKGLSKLSKLRLLKQE